MEKRLKKKVAEVLAGVLAPNEKLLIGTNGLHPRLTSGIGFYLTILVGATAGSALHSAFGWGTAALAPGIGIGVALVARWLYYFRVRSATQPVGAIPLIGLTNDRLIFVETDFWGRPTGTRNELAIADLQEVLVKKRLLGLPNTLIETADSRIIHYQVRYADRMRNEIERIRAEG
jgi:hypothetical protein